MTVEEFKTWLKQFDKNGDGRISKNELRAAIRSLGLCWTTLKSRQGIRAADVNQNGYIEDDEIECLIEFAQQKLGIRIKV